MTHDAIQTAVREGAVWIHKVGRSPITDDRSPMNARRAFTLVELMLVMTIIVIMSVLAIPAMNSRKGGNDLTKAADTIKGVLDRARSYAQSNNTYVWVGFYEEDAGKPSAVPTPNPGDGRLVMAVVASTDGTNLGADVSSSKTGTENWIDPTKLTPVMNVVKIDNAHLPLFTIPTGINCSTTPCDTFDTRPEIPKECGAVDYNCSRFGELNRPSPTAPYDPTNLGKTKFPFKFPISTTSNANVTQYELRRTLRFSPTGENRINSTYDVRQLIEIGLIQSRGPDLPTPFPSVGEYSGNVAAIQISGFNGDVKVYRR
jgi:prepilin-type N-terminal cleavage/methylation domain-containing protein